MIAWHWIDEEGQPKKEGYYLLAYTYDLKIGRVVSAHWNGYAWISLSGYVMVSHKPVAWAELPAFPEKAERQLHKIPTPSNKP